MFSSILTIIYICIVDMFVLVVMQRMTGLPPGVSDERVDLGCLAADRVLMCLRFAALSPFQSHLESCQFATVPCPQCQRSVRKSSVELHVTVECQRRPVSCPDCFTGFVYEEREVSPLPAVRQRGIWSPHKWGLIVGFLHQLHQQQCPFASVTCQYCDLDLVRNQVSEWPR